jgi:hypothetical protein
LSEDRRSVISSHKLQYKVYRHHKWAVGQFETAENERKNGDFEAISGRDGEKNARIEA